MKYIAIIDDSKLKKILEEGVEVKPIKKPIVVITNGNSAYITQGHIDAMAEYEQRKQIESIQKDFEGWSKRLAMVANKSTIPASKFAESIRILEQCGSSPKEKE